VIDGGIREFADVAELERIATEGWSSGVRAFVQAGAGDGRGIRANRAAHAKWSLRARVLVDVSCVDTATTALGVPLDLPMMIARPQCTRWCGLKARLRPRAERVTLTRSWY